MNEIPGTAEAAQFHPATEEIETEGNDTELTPEQLEEYIRAYGEPEWSADVILEAKRQIAEENFEKISRPAYPGQVAAERLAQREGD